MLKRFALCSLYAWGVPLALQLAVIIYRDSLGPPVRLCWFGNPISKYICIKLGPHARRILTC